ncbi:hypothetical protein SteCoe_34950 [Stentor coeruleus]|uniref:Uncharacterized protein n=1 Tax=Stentor coeruleus TaxID=5963 RepID=A0A1R2ATL4_9CILI|nr:hypothetical protein SteCoe_34950 [Stentor coeruleus]
MTVYKEFLKEPVEILIIKAAKVERRESIIQKEILEKQRKGIRTISVFKCKSKPTLGLFELNKSAAIKIKANSIKIKPIVYPSSLEKSLQSSIEKYILSSKPLSTLLILQPTEFSTISTLHHRISSNPLTQPCILEKPKAMNFQLSIVSKFTTTPFELTSPSMQTYAISYKFVMCPTEIDEYSFSRSSSKMKKATKASLRTIKDTIKPSKTLETYQVLCKPRIEFLYTAFEDIGKDHLRLVRHIFNRRIRNVMALWKVTSKRPNAEILPVQKPIIDILLVSSSNYSASPIIRSSTAATNVFCKEITTSFEPLIKKKQVLVEMTAYKNVNKESIDILIIKTPQKTRQEIINSEMLHDSNNALSQLYQRNEKSEIITVHHRICSNPLIQPDTLQKFTNSDITLAITSKPSIAPLELVPQLVISFTIFAKSIALPMEIDELSFSRISKNIKKGTKAKLRSIKQDTKPSKILESYIILCKPRVEFLYVSIEDIGKDHLRLISHIFNKRIRNILTLWSAFGKRPRLEFFPIHKPLLNILIVSHEKMQKGLALIDNNSEKNESIHLFELGRKSVVFPLELNSCDLLVKKIRPGDDKKANLSNTELTGKQPKFREVFRVITKPHTELFFTSFIKVSRDHLRHLVHILKFRLRDVFVLWSKLAVGPRPYIFPIKKPQIDLLKIDRLRYTAVPIHKNRVSPQKISCNIIFSSFVPLAVKKCQVTEFKTFEFLKVQNMNPEFVEKDALSLMNQERKSEEWSEYSSRHRNKIEASKKPIVQPCFIFENVKKAWIEIYTLQQKSLVYPLDLLEDRDRKGQGMKKNKKGALRSTQNKEPKANKEVERYAVITKPRVELFFTSFADKSKDHLRHIVHILRRRCHELLIVWKTATFVPFTTTAAQKKPLVELLTLTLVKYSIQPKNHSLISLSALECKSLEGPAPNLDVIAEPISSFESSGLINNSDLISSIQISPQMLRAENLAQETESLAIEELPEMSHYERLVKPLIGLQSISLIAPSKPIKVSLRNLSHIIKQKLAKALFQWKAKSRFPKKTTHRVLFKPLIFIEEKVLIISKSFAPISGKNVPAFLVIPPSEFKCFSILIKKSRPAIETVKNYEIEKLIKMQGLIRGFLTRQRIALVHKLKHAIFPLNHLFKYLSEKNSIRPVWDVLKSSVRLLRSPSPVTRRSFFESVLDGSMRLSPSPSRASSPRPRRSHRTKADRLKKRRQREAYSMNLQVLAPVLQKLIKKKEKIGLARMQSLLPSFVRRRYYAIQKGMKAIIHVSITNPISYSFEMMKYALYRKTYDGEQSLMSFTPEFVQFLPEIIQIQKFVRGHLARKRTRTLKEEKRKARRAKMPKFVLKSRVLQLKVIINDIIFRIKRDFMKSLQRNTGKHKINVYGLQKATKKIIGVLKQRLNFGYSALKKNRKLLRNR